MGKRQTVKMKLLIFIYAAINAEFIKKEESTQFLAKSNRRDCGDSCAYRKGTCHESCDDWCESLGGNHGTCYQEEREYCHDNCTQKFKCCLCYDCNYADRCN